MMGWGYQSFSPPWVTRCFWIIDAWPVCSTRPAAQHNRQQPPAARAQGQMSNFPGVEVHYDQIENGKSMEVHYNKIDHWRSMLRNHPFWTVDHTTHQYGSPVHGLVIWIDGQWFIVMFHLILGRFRSHRDHWLWLWVRHECIIWLIMMANDYNDHNYR